MYKLLIYQKNSKVINFECEKKIIPKILLFLTIFNLPTELTQLHRNLR